MEFISYNYKKTLLNTGLIFLIFVFSFLGYIYPIVNGICFWLIVFAIFILAIKNFGLAVILVLLELIIGNKGYLFSFTILHFVVSLRLALFAVIFCTYIFLAVKQKNITFFSSNIWPSFLLFCLFLGIGLIEGLARNSANIVFFDINAYFYLALIFPIFYVFNRPENIKLFIKIISVGALALSFLTIIIFLDFSIFQYSPSLIDATRVEASQLEKLQSLSTIPENARLIQTTKIAEEKLKLNWTELTSKKPMLYRWLRDTGTAEVTYLGGHFFRVFMPSHFYLMVYLILFTAYLLFKDKISKAINKWQYFTPLFILIASLISFSRSLWLGLIFAVILLFIGLPKKKRIKYSFVSLLTLIILFAFLYLVLPSFFHIIYSRVSSLFHPGEEIAAVNRLNLFPPIFEKFKEHLFFGSGFGTLIAFKSLIPGTDLVEYVKVYVYEWGFLDILVKVGILGLLAYLWFVYNIIKNGIKISRSNLIEPYLAKGFITGVAFLLVVHFTTPYLNHPLGLGLIMYTAAIFSYYLSILKTKPNV